MTEANAHGTDSVSAPGNRVQFADLHCPLCNYHLQGLPEPRCPECGYQFTLEQIRNPQLRLHPYIFEHHPERNATSFVQTAIGGLRPGKFWRSLTPVQPSNPRRLMLYWAICNGIVLFASLLLLPMEVIGVVNQQSIRAKQKTSVITTPSSRPGCFIVNYLILNPPPPPPAPQIVREVCTNYALYGLPGIVMFSAIWPWLSCAALLLFQISMRRARIRPMHLVRVCVYSFDLSVWWGLLILITTVVLIPSRGLNQPHFIGYWPQSSGQAYVSSSNAHGLAMIANLAMVMISTWRLRTACKYYLQFTFPLCTAVAVLVITALSVMSLLLVPSYF